MSWHWLVGVVLIRWVPTSGTLAHLLRQHSPCWWCHQIKCRVVFPPLLPFLFKDSSSWTALDDSTWSSDLLSDVIFCFKGGRCVRWTLACISFTTFSPLFAEQSPKWRAAAGWRSYEEWCCVQWLRCNRQVCYFGGGTNYWSMVVFHLLLWLYLRFALDFSTFVAPCCTLLSP